MKPAHTSQSLSTDEAAALLSTLKGRFEKHAPRHPKVSWNKVVTRLHAAPQKLWSLHQMETTGGEPDVIGAPDKAGAYLFVDCSPQSPAGRMSLCYDEAALAARKKFKPAGSAVGLATQMGVELLTEEEYFALQQLGEFDTKSSSWLKTPPAIRELDGAIFGDRRFGRVFVYHNGAESYYSGRGFRARLTV